MPGRNGTGPAGGGAGQGSGGGRGTGRGGGRGGRGMGGGTRAGAGPDGYCVCPQCGEKTPHQPGMPCMDMKCPKCGIPLRRE